MKRHTTVGLMLVASAFLVGCEANTRVEVRPPAALPAPQTPSINLKEVFSVQTNPVFYTSLRVDPRPAIDVLVDQVQKDLAAGQQDLKLGSVDKGRADLDRAVNRILLSGFQADSDPRLSKLFDQIGETLHASQVTSGEVGTEEAEETEAPAQPAPIDEIADLTLPPGDPRLV